MKKILFYFMLCVILVKVEQVGHYNKRNLFLNNLYLRFNENASALNFYLLFLC